MKKELQVYELLKEANWDLHLFYKKHLLEVCETSQEELQAIQDITSFAKRCRLDKENSKYLLTIDYMVPFKRDSKLAKGINQFVTSALIETISIDIKNPYDQIEYTIICPLQDKLPDWHITFGTKPDCLCLTCVYESKSITFA